MSVIFPLIKKNARIALGNIVNSIFVLLFPVLTISILSLFYLKLKGRQLPKESYHSYQKTISSSSNKFSDVLHSFLYNEPIALIASDIEVFNRIEAAIKQSGQATVERFYDRDSFISKNDMKNISKGFELFHSETNRLQIGVFINDTYALRDMNGIFKQKSKLSSIPLKESNYLINELQVYFYRILVHCYSENPRDDDISIILYPLSSKPISNDVPLGFFHKLYFLIISLSFISTIIYFTFWMIEEKENSILILLMRQGVTDWQYKIHWFITYSIFTIPTLTLSAFALNSVFFNNSMLLYLMIILLILYLDQFLIIICFSQYFNKTDNALGLIIIIYLGLEVLGMLIDSPDTYSMIKCVYLMYPQFAVERWLEILFLCCNYDKGIDSSLFYAEYNSITLFNIIYSSFWSITLKLFLYLALIFADSNTSPLDIICRILSFCCRWRNKDAVMSNDANYFNSLSLSMNEFNPSFSFRNFEEINDHDVKEDIKQRNILEISYLNKRYGKFKAIKDVSCKFFPGKIFALLGANGAGKTTLLKLLAGIEQADYGSISLFGHSMKDDPLFLLQNIGYCPQEDIFWKDLPVKEHLKLIQSLKGASNETFEEIMEKLQLVKSRDVLSKDLTEGCKRRLSLAMGLMGNNKLMLLDEPTNGMDYKSKRHIWKYLKNNKQNKIIIITTHEFEEAEYLSDAIGIMSEGELVCLGSSSYLKSQFPCGFNISFIFNKEAPTSSLEEKAKLIAEIKMIEPKAKIVILGKRFIKLNFPYKETSQNKIQALFEKIERIKSLFSLVDYTLSTASLEDVFLKINDNEFTRNLFDTEIHQLLGDISAIHDNSITFSFNNTSFNNAKAFDSNESSLMAIDCEESNEPISQQNVSKFFFKEKKPFPKKEEATMTSFFTEVNQANLRERSQMLRHLKRLFISLRRNKSDYAFLGFLLVFFLLLIRLFAHNAASSISPQSLSFNFNSLYSLIDNEVLYYQVIEARDTRKIGEGILSSIAANNKSTVTPLDYPHNLYDVTNDDFDDFLYEHFDKNQLKMYLLVRDVDEYVVFYSKINPSFKYAIVNHILSTLLHQRHNILTDLIVGVSSLTSPSEAMENDDIRYIFQMDYFIMLVTVFSLIIYHSNLITIPIKERIKETKQLNYLNGGSRLIYWFSLFTFDYIKLSFFVLIIYLFNLNIEHLSNTMMLPFIWGFSSITYTYLFSFAFDEKKTAWLWFIAINVCVTLLVYLFEGIYNIHYTIDPKISSVFLLSISDINPFTAFRRHFILIYKASSYQTSKKLNSFVSYYYYNCYYVFFLQAIVVIALLLCLENNYFRRLLLNLNRACKRRRTANEVAKIVNSSLYLKLNKVNEAMINERSKIELNKHLPVVINNLNVVHKSLLYENKIGVCNVYLGLEQNETFGLLGKNGSGKSTIIKAFIREEMYIHGTIKVFNRNFKEEFNKLRPYVGYCPQVNALYDYLTVKETFEYYLRKEMNIEELMMLFGLNSYANVLTVNLSGGNKRKLIFAVALINNPQLLLLDEPSKGVDSCSRRLMWKNITDLNKLKKNARKHFNLILSTHSFEEAEILCDNIGWIQKGTISVIGNSEELKLKYSKGYFLTLKFTKPSLDRLSELVLPISFTSIALFDNLTLVNIADFVSRNEERKKQMEYYYYFSKLDEIIQMVKDGLIKLHFIRRNQSYFVILMEINKKRQYFLFSTLLQLKYYDKDISELSIDLEPLDNFIDSI